MNKTRVLRIVAILFAFASINYAVYCELERPDEDSVLKPEFHACTMPRPEVCTMDYTPVCAELQDGTTKTYSNACTACADAGVSGYRDGACETE